MLERLEKRGKKHRKWKRKSSEGRAQDSMRALGKLTDIIDGKRVIVPDPPRIVRGTSAAGKHGGMQGFLNRYRKTFRSTGASCSTGSPWSTPP